MLTPKQKLFVQEYLIDQNATVAARRAGYSSKNADKIGSELLGKTRVSEAINSELTKKLNKLDLKSENILKELSKIAFFDVSDVLDYDEQNGFKLKPIRLWSDSAKSSVKSISTNQKGLAVQFHNKLSSLELLGTYLKMWKSSGDPTEEEQNQRRSDLIERVKNILNNRIDRDKGTNSP